jgi:hypothetical protein
MHSQNNMDPNRTKKTAGLPSTYPCQKVERITRGRLRDRRGSSTSRGVTLAAASRLPPFMNFHEVSNSEHSVGYRTC